MVTYVVVMIGVWAGEIALMVYITVGSNTKSILKFLDELGTQNFEVNIIQQFEG